jgi:multidrug efflux system membrane fusion protein
VPVVPVSGAAPWRAGRFRLRGAADKKVKLVVVKVGPSDGKNTAILGGLAKGQMVVAEGADGLDDGSVVRLAGAGGPQGQRSKKRKAAQ